MSARNLSAKGGEQGLDIICDLNVSQQQQQQKSFVMQ